MENKHQAFKEVKSRNEFLAHVYNFLPNKENSMCIEIGVDRGSFSDLILKELSPKKLYLVDPWEPGYDKNSPITHYGGSSTRTAYSTVESLNRVKTRFSKEIEEGQVELRQGFSYDVVDDLPDAYFDFIYIDATHVYESVKADLNAYLPKLKKNGVMAGHDYFSNNGIFSVIPAVDEFVEKYQFKWLAVSPSSSWDWALYK